MERLNIVDPRDHLATRGIILAKSRFQSLHVSTHCLYSRRQCSNQPSPHIHPSVYLAQNFNTTMPAISNYSFRVLPVRVQVQHLFILQNSCGWCESSADSGDPLHSSIHSLTHFVQTSRCANSSDTRVCISQALIEEGFVRTIDPSHALLLAVFFFGASRASTLCAISWSCFC